MKSAKQYTDNQIKWVVQHFTTELKAVRRAVDKVEMTNEKAVDKVEKNNENYRATQNEFRGQLKDQAGTFVTRRELWGAVGVIIAAALGILSYMK